MSTTEGFTLFVSILSMIICMYTLVLMMNRRRRLLELAKQAEKNAKQMERVGMLLRSVKILDMLTDDLLADGWTLIGGDPTYGRFKKRPPEASEDLILQVGINMETLEIEHTMKFEGENKHD